MGNFRQRVGAVLPYLAFGWNAFAGRPFSGMFHSLQPLPKSYFSTFWNKINMQFQHILAYSPLAIPIALNIIFPLTISAFCPAFSLERNTFSNGGDPQFLKLLAAQIGDVWWFKLNKDQVISVHSFIMDMCIKTLKEAKLSTDAKCLLKLTTGQSILWYFCSLWSEPKILLRFVQKKQGIAVPCNLAKPSNEIPKLTNIINYMYHQLCMCMHTFSAANLSTSPPNPISVKMSFRDGSKINTSTNIIM